MGVNYYLYIGPYVEVPEDIWVMDYTDEVWCDPVPGMALPNITAFCDTLEMGSVSDFEGALPLRSNLRDLALVETDAMVKEYESIFERMTLDEIPYRIQWGLVGWYG